MRFLVTAGSTREPIDRVRVWGNIFTGNTGLAIARALAAVGPVDLLTTNAAHAREVADGPAGAHPITPTVVATHGEMRGALAALMARQKYGAVFMTAAVADYRPVGVWSVVSREPAEVMEPDSVSPQIGPGVPQEAKGQSARFTEPGSRTTSRERWVVESADAPKVKSTHSQIAVLAERTEKLVDLFRTEWGHRGLLVKFKLEVDISKEELLRIGQASRTASGAEYLVANTLAMTSGPDAGAYLLSAAGEEWIPRDQLAGRLVKLVQPERPA